MKCKRLPIFILLLTVAAGWLSAAEPVPPSLQSATWLKHMNQDLIPFWTTPEALGQPVGNYPTIRTMDGKTTGETRRLPRMMGRQVFFYCAAYLMTGDPKLLEYAAAGVNWLADHAWDPVNQGWYAQLNLDGTPDGKRAKYAQDTAYTALGFAAWYFVTRDPKAEHWLKKTHDLIFDARYYWDAANSRVKDGLDFAMKAEKDQEGGGWELVALLDQLNAWMVLVQPVLSDPADRETWGKEMVVLGDSLVKYFLKDGIFWGQKDRVGSGGRHVDFGHTLKSYWMLHLVDSRLGTTHYKDLFDKEVPGWLKLSFDPEYGLWANSMSGRTGVRYGPAWWIFAETDQIAATLNLMKGGQTEVLAKTAQGWLDYFVDKDFGEIYPGIHRDGSHDDWPSEATAKVWDWKNGFHSAEHALVMYIHGLVLEGKPVKLYFAAENPDSFAAAPYVFGGQETGRKKGSPIQTGGRSLTQLEISFKLTKP